MINHVSAVAYGRNKWLKIKSRLFGQNKEDSHAGSIFRNMAVLATGSLAARAIGFAAIPFITRIYTPNDFGVLSVFASLTALIGPLGTLRYSSAIPLPKRDGTAVNLFVICMATLGVVSLLLSLLLWLFAPALLHLFSMDELVPYWWLVVIAVAGAGLFEVLSAWATREKAFKALAKRAVWQSASSAAVKIGLGLLGFKPVGLLIGQVVSQAGGSASLSFSFFHKLKANLRLVSAKRLSFIFRRYSDYPKFRLPSQFLLVFSSNAPLLFSAMMFGKETTGQLGLALTTLALPISLFGNTTGQAYYAEIARIGRKNPAQIRSITISMFKRLLLMSAPPFLMLLLAGPWLFSLVFGSSWHDAGIIASILSFCLLPQFVSAPIMNVLNVMEKQWLFLRINIIRAILLILVFLACYYLRFEANSTFFMYSIILFIHYTIASYSIYRAIR